MDLCFSIVKIVTYDRSSFHISMLFKYSGFEIWEYIHIVQKIKYKEIYNKNLTLPQEKQKSMVIT